MKRPELLVPASSLEVLKVAVIYGADAVYIGGEAFGLRAKAKNFSKEDMCEGIAFAHSHGVKVYVTVNILAHNRDLEGVREYLQELKEIGPDALIIADPGIFMYAKEICPEIERHISTQANNTNYETYRFWYEPWCQTCGNVQESFLWKRSGRSGHIFRRIWRLKRLSTAPCAFPIPEDVFSVTLWQEEMPIREPVPIPADGNILLWRRSVRENICRYLKMREELLFLIPRISVW